MRACNAQHGLSRQVCRNLHAAARQALLTVCTAALQQAG